jgi:hypothetical protein
MTWSDVLHPPGPTAAASASVEDAAAAHIILRVRLPYPSTPLPVPSVTLLCVTITCLIVSRTKPCPRSAMDTRALTQPRPGPSHAKRSVPLAPP